MAVEVYSDNFVGMNSPRFSFSRDSEENGTIINPINEYPCRLDHSLVDSAFDFAFNVDSSIVFQSSTADELFSNGKILPTSVRNEELIKVKQQQKRLVAPCLVPKSIPAAEVTEPRKKSLKEFLEDSSEEEEPNTPAAKSFWQFRRSNSLNSCERNQKKGLKSWKILARSGSIGNYLEKILEEEKLPKNNRSFFWKFSRSNSLKCENKDGIQSTKVLRRSHSTSDHYFEKSDLKPFKRSNSTGSAPNQTWKNKQQQQNAGSAKSTKKGQVKYTRSSSLGNYYNNSVKISPVLNLPSPYISRVSVDMFGFGSLFCNGNKDRKKKK